MPQVFFRDLGHIRYKDAWDYQERIFEELASRKMRNRTLPEEMKEAQQHFLLFCEHPPVYTLGKSGLPQHLLLNESQLLEQGIEFSKTNRGGDSTFHGPEQVVGYPILDMDFFFTDVHLYMRSLEEVIIRSLAEYGIIGDRLTGSTGVWLEPDSPSRARKICAMGVRLSRWITMHGWALNVNTNLDYFRNIIPCGIQDKGVTSIAKELGREVPMEEVKLLLRKHFSEVFETEILIEFEV